ncbi:MAG: uroporphyrinogen decarboxylase family protein [Actinomycetota bacterium]|nr:uroporphyrinogen decarboxylase family protein [Actinomycetota bacterium]
MNSREKFNSVMSFEDNKITMKTEFGFWAGTLKTWLKEGLPKTSDTSYINALDAKIVRASEDIPGSGELTDKNVLNYFNLDSYLVKFPFDISPGLKQKIIEDNKDYRIYTDSFGLKKKEGKITAGIPMVIEYPIKNRHDFYKYKDLYDADFKKRLPKNWANLKKQLKNRDYPIRLGGGPYGFSFFPRHLMGDVVYMTTLYDDPRFLKEFNDFFIDFIMNYWSLILKDVEIDCIFILEDMAYKTGSFISGQMFREFLTPYYIKFVDFLRQFKIKNILVDCDGFIGELIPLWIEAGVTGIFPIEAVNDVSEIRQRYPKLQLMGGIDKKFLFKESKRNEIDTGLEKTRKILDQGGYIPHIDHAVSEDVTWDNFRYYREKLNDIIDKRYDNQK